MNPHSQQIIDWLSQDKLRMKALKAAATLNLPDWCIGAGFVRNLVWDKLHGFEVATPFTDIDLIYFDPGLTDKTIEAEFEQRLAQCESLPWSVKNQARMHERNGDRPYRSSADAMSHWVEIETAVGAYLNAHGEIEIVAPFGLTTLFDLSISFNPNHTNPDDYRKRISRKGWLRRWPRLKVVTEQV